MSAPRVSLRSNRLNYSAALAADSYLKSKRGETITLGKTSKP